MPIRAEEKARYPKDWQAISQRVRERAGQRCEWCGVKNGALGGRARDGTFVRAQPLGEKLLRLEWPRPGTYSWCSDAAHGAHHLRIVRIVLTVAHLDHRPENCDDANLKALCQRCHLRHDAKMHSTGMKARRKARMAVGDLLGERGS